MQLRKKHFSPVLSFSPTDHPRATSMMLTGPFLLKSLLGHQVHKVVSYLSATVLFLFFPLLLFLLASSSKMKCNSQSSEILFVFSIIMTVSLTLTIPFLFHQKTLWKGEVPQENTSPILDFSKALTFVPSSLIHFHPSYVAI